MSAIVRLGRCDGLDTDIESASAWNGQSLRSGKLLDRDDERWIVGDDGVSLQIYSDESPTIASGTIARSFTFDGVLGPDHTNADLHDIIGGGSQTTSCADSNAVLVHRQRCQGKTHSLLGTSATPD